MAQFSFRLLQTFGTPRCKFRPSYDTSHSLYEPYSTLDCKNSKSIVKKNAGVKNKCYNIGLIQRRFWLAVIRANFHFLEQFKLFTQRIQIKQSCLETVKHTLIVMTRTELRENRLPDRGHMPQSSTTVLSMPKIYLSLVTSVP